MSPTLTNPVPEHPRTLVNPPPRDQRLPDGRWRWDGPPEGMRALAYEFARRVLKGEWSKDPRAGRIVRMSTLCRAVDLPENQYEVWRDRYDSGKDHPFRDAWLEQIRYVREHHASAMELVADKVGLGAGTDEEIKGATDRWKVLEQLGRFTPSSKLQLTAERSGSDTQVELFEAFLADHPKTARQFDRWLAERYAKDASGAA